MIPKPCGISIAANAPCSRREAISIARLDGASAAQHRGGGEAGGADQEQPPAPVDVAEPAAGDQADRRRRARSRRRSTAGRWCVAPRSRRIDGAATLTIVAVEQVHALGREHDEQDQPAARVAAARLGAERVLRGWRTWSGPLRRTVFVVSEQCSTLRTRSCQVRLLEVTDPTPPPARRRSRPASARAARRSLSREAIADAAMRDPRRRGARRADDAPRGDGARHRPGVALCPHRQTRTSSCRSCVDRAIARDRAAGARPRALEEQTKTWCAAMRRVLRAPSRTWRAATHGDDPDRPERARVDGLADRPAARRPGSRTRSSPSPATCCRSTSAPSPSRRGSGRPSAGPAEMAAYFGEIQAYFESLPRRSLPEPDRDPRRR